MFEMSLSTSYLLTLEESLEKNLIARGVLQKIEGLVFALCLDYISETSPSPSPSTTSTITTTTTSTTTTTTTTPSTLHIQPSRNGPDDILCIALISDYLRDISPTAQTIFEIETGISTLSSLGEQSGFGSIAAASLAHKVMKKGINSATAPLNTKSVSLDEITKVHIHEPEKTIHSRGILERNIVKAELGIDEIDKDKDCPLLISLIKRARENRIAKATVTNSWLNSLKHDEEVGKEKDERELDNGFPGSTFSKRDKSLKSRMESQPLSQPILILNL